MNYSFLVNLPISLLSCELQNPVIHNYSQVSLSPAESRLLSKGLSFRPNPPPLNPSVLADALARTKYSTLWRYYFFSQGYPPIERPLSNRNDSTTNRELPKYTPSPILRYLKHIEDIVTHACLSAPRERPNISFDESVYMNSFKDKDTTRDYLIKPSDKNLGLTLLDKSWYYKECRSHLEDTSVFRQVSNSEAFASDSRLIVLAIHRELQRVTGLRLALPSSFSIPFFYILPKIHKPTLSSRPIVGAHSWVLQPLAIDLISVLQPLIDSFLPQVLSNSLALLSDISLYTIPQSDQPTWLFTLDIVALYPSIPIDDAIKCIIYFLGLDGASQNVIQRTRQQLQLILNNSYCQHDRDIFLQIFGIAMGNSLAVHIANIFMGHFEYQTILSSYRSALLKYYRYVDDAFGIWQGSEASLLLFLDRFDSFCPTIKHTHVYSQHSVNFLDLRIRLQPHATGSFTIITNTHQKALNAYLYLPPTSHHPVSIFRSFILGELIRYIRNSTLEEDFTTTRDLFFRRLLLRGYNPITLVKYFSAVSYCQRPTLLLHAFKKASSNNFGTLKLPFFNGATAANLSQLLHEAYATLVAPAYRECITGPPLLLFTTTPTIGKKVTASSNPGHAP